MPLQPGGASPELKIVTGLSSSKEKCKESVIFHQRPRESRRDDWRGTEETFAGCDLERKPCTSWIISGGSAKTLQSSSTISSSLPKTIKAIYQKFYIENSKQTFHMRTQIATNLLTNFLI